ncbi:hypothetical protein K501DRAFT_333172, partial [Backusella circina FSU 941]
MTTQMNFDWLRNEEQAKTELDSRSFPNQTNSRKYTKEYMLSLYNPLENAEFTSQIRRRTEDKSMHLLDSNEKSLATSFMQVEPFSDSSKLDNNIDNENNASSSDLPLWAGVNQGDIGSFDTNGVYHLTGEDPTLDEPLEPLEQSNPLSTDILLGELKPTFSRPPPPSQHQVFMPFEQQQQQQQQQQKESDQWLYRDPSGHIQGPFSSQDMQEWYQSGYFDISLMVKKQDTLYFEPLAALVRNDPKTPFLTTMSWSADQQQQAYFQNNNNRMRPSLSTPINTRFLDTYPLSPTEEKGNRFNMMDGKRNEFNFAPPPLSNVNSFHNKNGFVPHMPMSPPTILPPTILPPSSISAQTSSMFNQNNTFIPPPSMPNNRGWSHGRHQESWELGPFDVNKQQQQQQQQELYNNNNNSNNKGGLNQQQIEQRYLEILRQNHQQSFQLQQRLLQQQQQQQQQQQEMQRRYMFMKNDPSPNFDQNLPHPITTVSNQDSLFEDVNQMTHALSRFELKEEDNGSIDDTNKTGNATVWESGVPKKSLHDDRSTLKDTRSNNNIQPQQQQQSPKVAISFSANTATRVQPKSNLWGDSGRPKRVSMTGSAPITRPTEKPAVVQLSKEPSEAFCKWCKVTLRGLDAGVNVDEILQMLLSFPIDDKSSTEIIQDIIYANSASMDGRRFASDFMKRRKADMKGELGALLPKALLAEEDDNSFKVVTKKGRKKFHH